MVTHLDNEPELLEAARNGDQDAFLTLITHYSPYIYRSALSLTANTADAEDVLQEVFLKSFANLAQFRQESRFYTWISRITINEALTRLRKRGLWKEVSIDDEVEGADGRFMPVEIEEWGKDPENLCFRSELQTVLAEALQVLDPKSRAIFTLRDIEQFSTQETAQMLMLPVAVIKTRLLRARLKLREHLNPYFRKGQSVAL